MASIQEGAQGAGAGAGAPAVSRRQMLGVGGAAAAAAGVGLASMVLRADSAGALTNSSFLYNVKDAPYLAVGNGVVDDTAAINSALSAAGSAGGGIVYLPPGTYRLTGSLNVPGAVWLQGVGYIPREGLLPTGSVLFGANPGASMVTTTDRNAHISDIAFYQTQNPNAPTAYPPAIKVNSIDVTIERVFLYNVYDGIFLNPGSGGGLGRLWVQQVTGHPLHWGIHINGASDVVHVNDIHFWPYTNPVSPSPWVRANGIGIHSQRNDNPFFSNIFCFGYAIGMKLSASAPNQSTKKLRMSNADFDACGTGLWMEGGCTAMVTNFTQAIGDAGFVVYDNSVLQATNVRISSVQTNGIRVDTGSQCYVDNVIIEGWNGSGAGYPAVENVANRAFSVIIGRTRAFGAGGPIFGGTIVQDA